MEKNDGKKLSFNSKTVLKDKLNLNSIHNKSLFNKIKKQLNYVESSKIAKPSPPSNNNKSKAVQHKRSISCNYEGLNFQSEDVNKKKSPQIESVPELEHLITTTKNTQSNEPKITIEAFVLPDKYSKDELKINFEDLIKIKNRMAQKNPTTEAININLELSEFN